MELIILSNVGKYFHMWALAINTWHNHKAQSTSESHICGTLSLERRSTQPR